MDFAKILNSGVSRRRFMKGALAGAGAVAASSHFNIAEALAAGKKASDIRGNGIPAGRVQISSNENPLGASPRAVEAITKHLHEINRYSFSFDLPIKLHQAHGINMGEDFKIDFEDMASFMKFREVNRIMVSAGSGPILQVLGVMAIGDGTGECIEAVPGYGQISRAFQGYQMSGQNVKVIRVPTTGDFTHDLDAMKAAVTPKTTIMTITNPNNPTGTIIPYDTLKTFVESIPEHVTILIDEAYIHFVREAGYQDAISLALERNNVVVTRTFSKIYGLAGMRIGYAITNKPLLDRMMLQQGFGGGLTSLSTHAAAAALDDHEFVTRTRKVTDDGKDYLIAEFDKMGLEYTPSHGNFMIVNIGRDSRRMSTEMRKRGVSIRSGGGYRTREHNLLNNHIRVSIGKPDELEVFISELKDILGKAS